MREEAEELGETARREDGKRGGEGNT